MKGKSNLLRMDNVSVVVRDIKATIAFFTELGMELEAETTVKGDWVGKVIGLKDVKSDIAMMRTPGGLSKIEFSSFKNPEIIDVDLKNEPFNVIGKHRIMFTVDDVKDTVARLEKLGATLVEGL